MNLLDGVHEMTVADDGDIPLLAICVQQALGDTVVMSSYPCATT
ncbi:MAG: hypothetical protein AAF708_02305 [Deinococcota bacterium]